MHPQLPLMAKYEIFGDITYSYNWNKKFNCHFFTTIRLANYKKYHVGRIYRQVKNGDYMFDGKIVDIRYCKINDLPDFTCYLDTGYNKQQTITIIKNMYSNKDIDWSKQQLSILLIEHLDWDSPQ